MTGQRSLTFKDLQDETLTLLGFRGDTGRMRDLVIETIRANHDLRANQGNPSWMVFPYPTTLTLTPGVRDYSLHPAFRQPIYFKSRTTGNDLVEQKSDMLVDQQLINHDVVGNVGDFQLKGVLTVQAQPATPSVIAVDSSDSGDDAGKTITVTGETVAGAVVTETIAVGASGSTTFARVLGIRKDGTGWSGTMTATAGATTILALGPAEYGKEFRHLYLLQTPSSAEILEYSFYRFANRLEADNDIPSIPAPYSRLLIYDTLLDLQGYARFTGAEAQRFQDKQMLLEHELWSNYEEGQSGGAAASYVHYNPR